MLYFNILIDTEIAHNINSEVRDFPPKIRNKTSETLCDVTFCWKYQSLQLLHYNGFHEHLWWRWCISLFLSLILVKKISVINVIYVIFIYVKGVSINSHFIFLI